MEKLFLEGDRFVGKSTLLKKHLKRLSLSVEGFYVERRIDKTNRVIGFELRDAQEIKSGYVAPPNDAHCFIWNNHGKRMRRLEVFEQFGIELLDKAMKSSADIILLDEIGGIELLSDSFSQQLFSLLRQSRRIIGVYKSKTNYQCQKQNVLGKITIDQQRKELEKIILQNDCEIVKLTQGNMYEIDKLLCGYLM